jgi:hypothetical protein
MSSANLNAFVEVLRAQTVIPADAPPPSAEGHDSPWFVTLLQGFAGWLAGIFLVFLIGIVLKPSSFSGFLVLGMALLLAAWTIYQLARRLMFLDQLAMAISIAGQCCVAGSVVQDHFSALLLSVTVLLLQVSVFFMMPNRAARTLAALFAAIAWAYTLRFLIHQQDSSAEIFAYAPRDEHALLGALTFPVVWLLTWVPLIAGTLWLMRREARWMSSGAREYARPALIGVLVALAVGGIATEPFASLFFTMNGLGLPFSWWALFPLLSIALAGFAGYGAFQLRSTGLLGFAILMVLLNLSRFYYLYGTTLLWKSLIMLVVGSAMLAASLCLQRRDAAAGDA